MERFLDALPRVGLPEYWPDAVPFCRRPKHIGLRTSATGDVTSSILDPPAAAFGMWRRSRSEQPDRWRSRQVARRRTLGAGQLRLPVVKPTLSGRQAMLVFAPLLSRILQTLSAVVARQRSRRIWY
jgi:hypothetical protein